MTDVADRVKKIVVEHLGVEADKVSEDASFIDDLGADSLDTVELVMAFEEEFGVEIPRRRRREDPDGQGRDRLHRDPRQGVTPAATTTGARAKRLSAPPRGAVLRKRPRAILGGSRCVVS